jgi:ElaB/YqjD/DUF883 family membrane-anchored ribosome-binding protein
MEANVHHLILIGACTRPTVVELWRNIVTTLKTITDKASETGREAKESLEDLAQSAGRRLDHARDETGEALHAAADSVRTTGSRVDNLASSAANRLDATASYVEDHDLRDVLTGLRRIARRHLTGSLLTAAAIGFLAGVALGRATRFCGKEPEST